VRMTGEIHETAHAYLRSVQEAQPNPPQAA
jgi:hypothetical protein